MFLPSERIFVRQFQVKQAFHSHHMLPLAPAYESALAGCRKFVSQPLICRMFSSVTARLADHTSMGPKYWSINMTSPVRFSDVLAGILLDELDEQNVDILIEIGLILPSRDPDVKLSSHLSLIYHISPPSLVENLILNAC